MKLIKSIIPVTFFTLLCTTIRAQAPITLAKTTLWKVEHPKAKKTSYLFGTIHMQCEKDFVFPEKVTRTMEMVDKLVLEVDLSDPNEIQEMQTAMLQSEKVSEVLTTEQYAKVDSLVQLKLGASLANFDTYGLAALHMAMITKMLPCTTIKSFEMELMQMASAEQKPIGALESVKEQMGFINKASSTSFTYEQILLFDTYRQDFIEAIENYNQNNLQQAIDLLTQDKYMDAASKENILNKRNQNWVAKIPGMMAESSNLFAVGMAHLANENGLIQLLREAGCTVSPVLD